MEVSNQAFICQENRSTYDEIKFVIIANVNQESDADDKYPTIEMSYSLTETGLNQECLGVFLADAGNFYGILVYLGDVDELMLVYMQSTEVGRLFTETVTEVVEGPSLAK